MHASMMWFRQIAQLSTTISEQTMRHGTDEKADTIKVLSVLYEAVLRVTTSDNLRARYHRAREGS
jgi:hypothetical protein